MSWLWIWAALSSPALSSLTTSELTVSGKSNLAFVIGGSLGLSQESTESLGFQTQSLQDDFATSDCEARLAGAALQVFQDNPW